MKKTTFLHCTSAATAIEYGLIVGLVTTVIIISIKLLGLETTALYDKNGEIVTAIEEANTKTP